MHGTKIAVVEALDAKILSKAERDTIVIAAEYEDIGRLRERPAVALDDKGVVLNGFDILGETVKI
jgi:hypothetical protein